MRGADGPRIEFCYEAVHSSHRDYDMLPDLVHLLGLPADHRLYTCVILGFRVIHGDT